MEPVIVSFQNEHRFLSNFWPALVRFDGAEYPTVEHAYVAAKTLDNTFREVIRTTPRPGAVKRIGRMRSFELRPGWDDMKLDIMTDLVRQKFRHQSLRDQLVATGDADLVEGNTWGDTFWGVCRGEGQNHLGKILMLVRSEINSAGVFD